MRLFNGRLIFLLPFFLCPLFFANAQEVDYNRIIPPPSPSADFSEKLVRLAWVNYPANDAIQSSVIVAKQELTLARWSWLSRINATGNINEFTLTGGPDNLGGRQLFFPRYNFSIALSPVMLFQIPAEKRRAKENLNIAQFQVNEQKLLIRKQVLQLYQAYIMNKQILELETRMFESATTAFELKEERFKRGQLVLDEYNESANVYLAQQRQRLQSETNYINAKLELESLIGVRIEDVK